MSTLYVNVKLTIISRAYSAHLRAVRQRGTTRQFPACFYRKKAASLLAAALSASHLQRSGVSDRSARRSSRLSYRRELVHATRSLPTCPPSALPLYVRDR